MAINKVIYNSNTLIDLTGDTVTASDVAEGKTFHLADGTQSTGTYRGMTMDQTSLSSTICTSSTDLSLGTYPYYSNGRNGQFIIIFYTEINTGLTFTLQYSDDDVNYTDYNTFINYGTTKWGWTEYQRGIYNTNYTAHQYWRIHLSGNVSEDVDYSVVWVRTHLLY